MMLYNFTRLYADYADVMRATTTRGGAQFQPKRKKLKGYQKKSK